MNHALFGTYLLIKALTLIPLMLWLGFVTDHRAHSPIHDHPSSTLSEHTLSLSSSICVNVPNNMPIKRCWPASEPVDLLQVGVLDQPAQNP